MRIFILLLLFSQISFAQKRDEIISKIAEETCTCVEKKKVLDNSKSYNQLKVNSGLCILESYQNLSSNLKSKLNFDFKNSDDMKAFGVEVGLKMVKICPDFIYGIGEEKKSFDKEDAQNQINDDAVDEEEDSFVTGMVYKIKSNQFITFSIKETSGRTVEFILLENFNNAFLLTEDLLKPNDVVDVYYYESELFDATVNKFITFKVITDIIKK